MSYIYISYILYPFLIILIMEINSSSQVLWARLPKDSLKELLLLGDRKSLPVEARRGRPVRSSDRRESLSCSFRAFSSTYRQKRPLTQRSSVHFNADCCDCCDCCDYCDLWWPMSTCHRLRGGHGHEPWEKARGVPGPPLEPISQPPGCPRFGHQKPISSNIRFGISGLLCFLLEVRLRWCQDSSRLIKAHWKCSNFCSIDSQEWMPS